MIRQGHTTWLLSAVAGLLACGAVIGCWNSPSAHTTSRNYSHGDAPIDPPNCSGTQFDDITSGGKLFKLYCGACHNARALGERPFANYEVAVAHMRQQAYLTGKEYRQIIHFVRRWHDVGPPTPDVDPSPKKLTFSQPIPELRPQGPALKNPAPEAKEARGRDELITPALSPIPNP